jgi:hypothetical protein
LAFELRERAMDRVVGHEQTLARAHVFGNKALPLSWNCDANSKFRT